MTRPTITDTEAALFGLLADIRDAVGDPEGKLMQSELVEHCREMREERDRLREEIRAANEKVLTVPLAGSGHATKADSAKVDG